MVCEHGYWVCKHGVYLTCFCCISLNLLYTHESDLVKVPDACSLKELLSSGVALG